MMKSETLVFSQRDLPFYIQDVTLAHFDLKIIKRADALLNQGVKVGSREYTVDAIDWQYYAEPERSAIYQLHAWAFVDSLINAYMVSGDAHYAQAALTGVLSWCRLYIEAGDKHEFAWYDMAVGLRASKLPWLLQYCVNTKSEKTAVDRLWQAMHKHLEYLLNLDNLAEHSNHGVFQLIGALALVDFMRNHQDLISAQKTVQQKLIALLKKSFSDDGLHKEHSPLYHIYLFNSVNMLKKSGFLPKNEFDSLYQQALKSILWLCSPDGKILPLGDSKAHQLEKTLPQSIMLEIENLREQAQGQCHCFKQGGLFVYRSNWLARADMLVFQAAFHNRMHKHADEFHFLYYHQGKPIFVDAGMYKYNYQDPKRRYIESTRAHNTVEIDGHDYSRYVNDAFQSAIEFTGQLDRLVFASSYLYRKRQFQTHHRRHLCLISGVGLIIFDALASDLEHDYTQWFHLHPDFDELQQTSNWVIAAPFQLSCFVDGEPHDNLQLIKGQVEPHYQGWVCQDSKATSLTENFAIGLSYRAKAADLLTFVCFQEEEYQVVATSASSYGRYFSLSLVGPENYEIQFTLHKDYADLLFKRDGQSFRQTFPLS